ncbi:hypothetical protein BDD12DRAFT_880720 [Trichophaea hybrida]|nr:hypothetical protein BDD12DRAFT_880720 [Trichophaea hybrida]
MSLFPVLCSFTAAADSSINSTHLDTAVDTEQVFNIFVEFIYGDTYALPEYLTDPWKAQVHGEVYVLAERLMMPDLKDVALRYMVNTLEHSYSTEVTTSYDAKSKKWKSKDVSTMDAMCLVQLIDTIYSHTLMRHPDIYGRLSGGVKKKEKGKATEGSRDGEVADDELSLGPLKNGIPTAFAAKLLPKDRIRQLLARNCASRVVELREVPEFLRVYREKGEFAEDLIMEIE